MTFPRAGATEFAGRPPSHRGLGVLGWFFSVLALGGALALLAIGPTYEDYVEVRAGEDTQQVDATVVCHSVLSGGPSGQLEDLGDDQVSESDASGAVARCSQLRDQAIGRALLLSVAGVLWGIAVTAALGRAALRRAARTV